MDRLRSVVVVIAAVLGFLGLFLLGEAESSASGPFDLAPPTPAAERALDPHLRTCPAGRERPGAYCAVDAQAAQARGLRSGGATR